MNQPSESQTQGDLLMIGEIPEPLNFSIAFLAEQGYQIHHTLSSEKVLEDCLILPDLIILSTALQTPDCYTVCQTLKERATIAQIPVIFLHVGNPDFQSHRVFQVGGADYFNYLCAEEEILVRIKHQVSLTRLQKRLDRQTHQLQQTIQELQKLENYMHQVDEELRFSFLDALTGAANRRRFEEYLDKEWRRCARDRVTWRDSHLTALSLIICDLDYFQAYNEAYGTGSGDECLKKIARSIQNVVKRPADLVARYHEASFAILLPNTNLEGAITVASLIRLEVQEMKIIHAHSQVSEYITLSYGVATGIPTQALSSEILAKAAKQALVQAKEQGRDRIFSDSV